MLLFYGGAVGIMIIDRNLYTSHKGFNEEFIYMNNMDTEFINRLRMGNDFYNLGLKCDADFYHLHHPRTDGAKGDTQVHAPEEGSRSTNPDLIRTEQIPNRNSPNWGLNDEELPIHSL